MCFKNRPIGVHAKLRVDSPPKIMLRLVFLIIFSTSIRCDHDMIKRWIVNTNLTVASRYWDSLVTIGSYTFNGSMTHAVAIPRAEDDLDEFCELIYPLDKLPASVSSDLYNTTEEGKCVDEELTRKMDRVFWLDPRNWQTSNKATPHVERIPCNNDVVRIPNTTSTFIILPPHPVTLDHFQFGFTYITSFSWKYRYSESDYFRRHFVVKSSTDLGDMFNITLDGFCKDRTGCICGTSEYLGEVCSFVINDCAKDLPCANPILPVGHCCPVCGAVVLIQLDEKVFVYNKVESIVEKFVHGQSEQSKYEVDMYMSKISKDSVHVVLLPKDEYSDDLLDLANGLSLYLNKRASTLGIEMSYTEEAGKPIGGQQGWSTIVKIFIGLTIALIAGAFLVYANKSKWLDGIISFWKGLGSTKIKEDKNLQFETVAETKEEENANNTQNDEIKESTSVEQEEGEEEGQIILIDTVSE